MAIEALTRAGQRLVELQGSDRDDDTRREGLFGLDLDLDLEELDLPFGDLLAHAASRLQRLLTSAFADLSGIGVEALSDELARFALLVERALPLSQRDDTETTFFVETVDLLLALLHGVAEDDLLERGSDSINDQDLADWLRDHGADIGRDPVRWPALLRAVYDGCFAYEDGVKSGAGIAAGRAIQGVMRCIFHYRGAVISRMKAGMGDTVIAPLYEVLTTKRQNVRVLFFHAAQELIPSGGRQAH